jgi:hypothetical protein
VHTRLQALGFTAPIMSELEALVSALDAA